ncbi:MAG: presqualene diphosphate synthase HpnD [Ignavibacteriales bacterium]|nr:presqualene diphosphate synthase HpnD [Ignavibacteriales bacterium]
MSYPLSRNIARRSNSSFLFAFTLLPQRKREAMNVIYAFCRLTDDIVDDPEASDDKKRERLETWKDEVERAFDGPPPTDFLKELRSVVLRFKIPRDPFFELIRGMEMDLNRRRYNNFDDLCLYCYRAASTVGLMSAPVFGYRRDTTLHFAIDLGIALQLTNILRDVKQDAENGRIYLPLDEMKAHDYSEEDLFAFTYNDNFRALMKFEVERAKRYYNAADDALHPDDVKSMYPARAMRDIYRDLLGQIEAADYNVFSDRFRVPGGRKLSIAFRYFMNATIRGK